MTERRFIELWYSQYDEQHLGTKVATGARLDGDRVRSGVSVVPEQVQAIAVLVSGLQLTLEGGATVWVPVLNLSSYAEKRLAHLRKAAIEVREQLARRPEDLLSFDEAQSIDDPEVQAGTDAHHTIAEDIFLELVREIRDLCADRVHACKYIRPEDARPDLMSLDAATLLEKARERMLERGHTLGAT